MLQASLEFNFIGLKQNYRYELGGKVDTPYGMWSQDESW